MLSVCCLTGGREPRRLAAILTLLRPLADEIVVAVDERRPDAAATLASHATRVVTFPYADPTDRPIPWLFGLCGGDWILNLDDDEVPGARLLAELPRLVATADVTHCWIARRWLHPGVATYLDAPPWCADYQLRLVRADPRFLQFSDELHRPVVCHGPMRFVDAPLWHLDTAVSPLERRREKALVYEQARRGMRVAGVSHNSGFYVPELRPGVATAAIPPEDVALVEAVLAELADPAGEPAPVERATREQIDAAWPGAPFPATLHRARLRLGRARETMVAGVQQTVDVHLTNESECIWHWGEEADPALRLGYRWVGREEEGLHTALPCDLPPGETMLVPVHAIPPDEPGAYILELDVVHEHVRWLGASVRVEVDVRPRRRVALAGEPATVERILDALLDLPELEPVLLDADEGLPVERFGHPRVPGLRSFLFDAEPARRVGPRLLTRTLRLLAAAAGRGVAGAGASALLAGLAGADALVLAGADWPADAPRTRELWRLASTVAAARALGVPVLLLASPPCDESFDRALVWIVERLASPVAEEKLLGALAVPSRV